ncbi:MAG: CBS domain-containing protein [Planctomycetes bacterium]|nr:CBS domain-containing protein [Planctomycetota bacterium]
MKRWTDWKAEDLMSSPVTVLGAGANLRDAARTLTEEGISGAPVVNQAGEPVGVVSLFDIVTQLAGLERPAGKPSGFYSYEYPSFEENDRWEGESAEEGGDTLSEVTIGEIMTPDIIQVAPETKIPEVAETMWRRHIHRVFVGRGGKLLGVISSMDLMIALTALEISERKPRRARGGQGK